MSVEDRRSSRLESFAEQTWPNRHSELKKSPANFAIRVAIRQVIHGVFRSTIRQERNNWTQRRRWRLIVGRN